MTEPSPALIVIFGASGDLARRKLIPAIYELARQGLLHPRTCVLGFARSALTDEQFRAGCHEGIAGFGRTQPLDPAVWAGLESRLYYCAGEYGTAEGQTRLAGRLAELEHRHETGGNRLYYLATPPTQFEPIIEQLGAEAPPAGWRRLIIEKPFGRDLASARRLNGLIHRTFAETSVFRIDHYLGKETVQNLMVLRFANALFEPVWNYKYVDHIQITVAETVGVGTRGGYYDSAGALRDMVQNHIFQLLALVAMEPPAALDAQSIRDEKVKVFRSIRAIRPDMVEQVTARGQYASGAHAGGHTDGYLHEEGVRADSRTESLAAVKLVVDNWRWSGMPFYLRTGKCLATKLSEVVVRFRSPPQTLFHKECDSPIFPNDLILRLQPDEGISVRINGKVPGGAMSIRSVALDFLYQATFRSEPPEAYERLIQDALLGDQTLFIRADEAEAAWAIIDPIAQAWAQAPAPPQPYVPGSWGPPRAAELIERDGRRWFHSGEEAEPITACAL